MKKKKEKTLQIRSGPKKKEKKISRVIVWEQLITFSPPHTRERARPCLSLEFKECVQPGVTVCRVSVWGWLSPPPPSLLLFLMGNLDKLREAIVPNTRSEKEGKFHLCGELQRLSATTSGKKACWPQEVIRICGLPPYGLHLYGGSRVCRCAVHIISHIISGADSALSLLQVAVHTATVEAAL